MIAYAGHFNGQMLNPMTGVVETNGTSIVDVTDPRHPKYLKHLIADKGGARMAKLCDGNILPHGLRGHTYLLRENGAVSHEVWDVTDPADPTLVSTPVTGQDVTHRNWWDCTTGIAYIVAGATKPTDPAYDGWNTHSSPNQHLKIYDLSDPANPKYIMDFGYPGQNPGSTFLMPGTETTTKVVPPGVHGPIVVSTLRGQAINRLYMPYGVGSDGIIQINDLTKVSAAAVRNRCLRQCAQTHRCRTTARPDRRRLYAGCGGRPLGHAALRHSIEAVQKFHRIITYATSWP